VPITVTTLEELTVLNAKYGEDAMADRCYQLEEQDSLLYHQVDATALHQRHDAVDLFSDCGIIWWNFPFTGQDENDEVPNSVLDV